MRTGDGGVETGCGDGREKGSVTKKKGANKSTIGISASRTPDSRDRVESISDCDSSVLEVVMI